MSTVQGSATHQSFATLDLAALLEPVKQELTLVEQWLATNLIDDNPFVTELLSQLCQAGGKRIRSGLVLLSAKATAQISGDIGRLQIILAVLTELIHTASLVHDDVIDKASLRRGQETINKKWNDRLAVLLGDLLFAQASICLARIMNPVIVGIYGQVLGDLCAGEIRQMKRQFACDVDWDSYVRKTVGKTASLFAAGCHSAPILNGCDNDTVEAMKEYGLNLGICFQIVDDLLDVTGTSAELGKAAGSDLAHGVINPPALFILERRDEPASRLEKLIKSRAVSQPEGIEEALEIIRLNGGVEATAAYARGYAEKSQEALRAIPPSPHRDSLGSIVDLMLMRTR